MSGPRREGEQEKFQIPIELPRVIACYSFQILEEHLRKRPLLNNRIKGFYPYFESTITLEEVSLKKLRPCALYVLSQNLQIQRSLRKSFLETGIDPLNLPSDKAVIQFDWGISQGLEL